MGAGVVPCTGRECEPTQAPDVHHLLGCAAVLSALVSTEINAFLCWEQLCRRHRVFLKLQVGDAQLQENSYCHRRSVLENPLMVLSVSSGFWGGWGKTH